MKLGVIGLGKMGKNIVLNLLDHKYEVVVNNRSPEPINELKKYGAIPAYSPEEFTEKLSKQKIIWLMIPADSVDKVISQLKPNLNKNDIIIDGGNSFYKDSIRRYNELSKLGIEFIDVGFSGGPNGARNGGCLMVGGKENKNLSKLFVDLSVKNGLQFFKSPGAGHFVKMVHNGIEYGMMQSIAEGFEILKNSKYKLNLEKVAELYNHGSVIESRLIEWTNLAYKKYGNELKEISGVAQESGEGSWTVKTAKEMKIKSKVLEDSLKARRLSRKKPNYQGKVITALRSEFGGHKL